MTDIRQWVLAQREGAMRDLERARMRVEVLDQMLATLPRETAPPREPAKQNGVIPARPLSASQLRALALLKEAGPDGLSAKELAVREKAPLGTVSSRLSIMKSAGLAGLNNQNHKYFALHSEPQDNNLDGVSA